MQKTNIIDTFVKDLSSFSFREIKYRNRQLFVNKGDNIPNVGPKSQQLFYEAKGSADLSNVSTNFEIITDFIIVVTLNAPLFVSLFCTFTYIVILSSD